MMATWFALYFCVAGANCSPGEKPIISQKAYFSEQVCREEAELIATHMSFEHQQKWEWQCQPFNYRAPEHKSEP